MFLNGVWCWWLWLIEKCVHRVSWICVCECEFAMKNVCFGHIESDIFGSLSQLFTSSKV